MKNALTCAGSLLWFPAAAAAQAASDPVLSTFEKTIQLAKAGLPHISALVPWLAAFVVGTIIFAAASSIIQAFSKPWVKPATVALGAIITLIGTAKATFFAIDYATCAQTINDMQGTISRAEAEIQNYEQDGLKDDVKAKYLTLIEHDVDTLRKLDNLLRGSGHAILPPAFLRVVYAQQSASQSPYFTIRQEASVTASTKAAAYEFAKFQALETIARKLKPTESWLDEMIQYLDRFAQPGNASCRPEEKMFNCTFEVTLTSVYLGGALFQSRASPSVRPKAEVHGLHGVEASAHEVFLVTSNINFRGDGFVFHLVENPKSEEWDLAEITAFADGLWSFEFSAGGSMALLPVRNYEGKFPMPVTYQMTPPYPLHLSSKPLELTVAGYRPKPPAMAK